MRMWENTDQNNSKYGHFSPSAFISLLYWCWRERLRTFSEDQNEFCAKYCTKNLQHKNSFQILIICLFWDITVEKAPCCFLNHILNMFWGFKVGKLFLSSNIPGRDGGSQITPSCGFSKNISSKERVKPWFFVTFNIILKHIFPESFIEFYGIVQKIWRSFLSILAVFINFPQFFGFFDITLLQGN